MTRCLLLVGTPKGAFILESDAGRRDWSVSTPTCDGWPIQDINVDRATNTLFAGAGSPWYGAAVFRSDPCRRGPRGRMVLQQLGDDRLVHLEPSARQRDS